MNTIKNLITNKAHLIVYWFLCLYFQQFVTQLLLPSTIRFTLWHILWVIDIAWVMIILIYDIYKKNICVKTSKIFILTIFVLFTTISWILKQPNHGHYYIFTLVTLYEQVFIFYTYAKDKNVKDIKFLLNKLATLFVYLTSLYTSISLVSYFINCTSFSLPNGSTINMLILQETLSHNPIRLQGLWTNTSIASFDCYLAILLSLYLIENGGKKYFHYILIFLNSIMIYLANSRLALIILAFIFTCLSLFKFKKNHFSKKSLINSGFLFTILIILFILYRFYSNPNLLCSIINNPYDTFKNLSSRRLQMAEDILSNLKNFYLLGNGYCNNVYLSASIREPHPHNIFLALLLYTGIPGLVLFTMFLILNVKDIVHNLDYIKLNNLKWLVVLVICVFFESLLDIAIIGAPINIQTLYFYLCLGILVKDSTNEKL